MTPDARANAKEGPRGGQRTGGLVVYVLVGLLLGATYVTFDVVSEARLERGTLTGGLARAHEMIDHTFPIVIGALLGVVAHYVRLRARLSSAEEAASRADALRTRLQKVERDQAIWVLVAAVLHELNNPLHALGLALEELGDGADATTRGDLLLRARAQTERALTQLRLLRAMRGLGEPSLRRVGLDGVVRAVSADVEALAREDGAVVRLSCASPVEATADPDYVRTIVENVLDNSLHALRARGGGAIDVSLRVEGRRAMLRVQDDGAPLEGAIRETLFDPLRTTKTHGLGLGLPIARALARAMGGDLVLEDGDAKIFRLELPLEAPG